MARLPHPPFSCLARARHLSHASAGKREGGAPPLPPRSSRGKALAPEVEHARLIHLHRDRRDLPLAARQIGRVSRGHGRGHAKERRRKGLVQPVEDGGVWQGRVGEGGIHRAACTSPESDVKACCAPATLCPITALTTNWCHRSTRCWWCHSRCRYFPQHGRRCYRKR